METVQVAVTFFQDRVDAGLPENDLGMSLDIFVSHWLEGQTQAQRIAFARKAKMWFRALKFSAEESSDWGIREFEDAAQL